MPHGMKVGLGLGDIVLDGAQHPPNKAGARPSNFRPMSIVAKRSPISATAELLLNLFCRRMVYAETYRSVFVGHVCRSRFQRNQRSSTADIS